MTNYTLIAYLEGSSGYYDRCGDWESGQDSELNIEYFQNEEDLAKRWASLRQNNTDYEFTLLIDGRDANTEDDLSDDYYRISDLADKEYDVLLSEYLRRAEAARLENLRKAEAEKERLRLIKEQAEEKREREELLRLQMKYGQGRN